MGQAGVYETSVSKDQLRRALLIVAQSLFMVFMGWLLYKALWGKRPMDYPVWLVWQAVIAGIGLFGTGLSSWYYHMLEGRPGRLIRSLAYGFISVTLVWTTPLYLPSVMQVDPLEIALIVAIVSTSMSLFFMVYGWFRRSAT